MRENIEHKHTEKIRAKAKQWNPDRLIWQE